MQADYPSRDHGAALFLPVYSVKQITVCNQFCLYKQIKEEILLIEGLEIPMESRQALRYQKLSDVLSYCVCKQKGKFQLILS